MGGSSRKVGVREREKRFAPGLMEAGAGVRSCSEAVCPSDRDSNLSKCGNHRRKGVGAGESSQGSRSAVKLPAL